MQNTLNSENSCAADFALLNLPKGKSLGRSKPATSSYAQALQHTMRKTSTISKPYWTAFYRNKMSTINVSECAASLASIH